MLPPSSLPSPSLSTQAQAEAEGRKPSSITCTDQVAQRVPKVTLCRETSRASTSPPGPWLGPNVHHLNSYLLGLNKPCNITLSQGFAMMAPGGISEASGGKEEGKKFAKCLL